MNKYKFEITEILQLVVEIDGDNENDARSKCLESYDNGEIVLGSDNFVETIFKQLDTN